MGYPHVMSNGERGTKRVGRRIAERREGWAGQKCCLLTVSLSSLQLRSPPTLFPSSCDILIRTDSPGKDRGHIPCRVSLLPFRSVAILPPGSL